MARHVPTHADASLRQVSTLADISLRTLRAVYWGRSLSVLSIPERPAARYKDNQGESL